MVTGQNNPECLTRSHVVNSASQKRVVNWADEEKKKSLDFLSASVLNSTRQCEPHAVSEHRDVRKPFRQRQRQGFVKIKGKTRAAYERTVHGKNGHVSPDNLLFASCVQSLKFFKHKQKRKWSYCKSQINKSTEVCDNSMTKLESISPAKIAPPSPPTQPRTPPPSYSTVSSMFTFGRSASSHKHITQHFRHILETVSSSSAGFGNRFGKPKGPRSYPQTWVWGSRPRLLRVQLIAKRFGTAGSLSPGRYRGRSNTADLKETGGRVSQPGTAAPSAENRKCHAAPHGQWKKNKWKKTSSDKQKWEVWHFLLKCSWQPSAIHIAACDTEPLVSNKNRGVTFIWSSLVVC